MISFTAHAELDVLIFKVFVLVSEIESLVVALVVLCGFLTSAKFE